MASKYSVSFSGIIIEATVADHEWVREVLESTNEDRIIVGLDCEWKPNASIFDNNKTATLQLCVSTKTLITQLLYLDYIPQSLQDFLSRPDVIVVRVEVDGDVSKLRREYGLRCGNSADIQAISMTQSPLDFLIKPGLKELARRVAGLYMEKPIHVCRSNWEAWELSLAQVGRVCLHRCLCFLQDWTQASRRWFWKLNLMFIFASGP